MPGAQIRFERRRPIAHARGLECQRSHRALRSGRARAAIQMHDKMVEPGPQPPVRVMGRHRRGAPIERQIFSARVRCSAFDRNPSDNGRPGRCRREGVAAWALAVRRPQVQTGCQAFRLRESERSQGREGPSVRDRHLRQFQHGRRGGERDDGRGRRSRLRHADDSGAGRGVGRKWPACRKHQPSRRFLLGHLSPAAAGEVSRRHAGDTRRRDLLVQCIQTEQPATFRLFST
jgi:hypothetical protein